jgi:hypothetical protein
MVTVRSLAESIILVWQIKHTERERVRERERERLERKAERGKGKVLDQWLSTVLML